VFTWSNFVYTLSNRLLRLWQTKKSIEIYCLVLVFLCAAILTELYCLETEMYLSFGWLRHQEINTNVNNLEHVINLQIVV